jgi:hypothetical protein
MRITPNHLSSLFKCIKRSGLKNCDDLCNAFWRSFSREDPSINIEKMHAVVSAMMDSPRSKSYPIKDAEFLGKIVLYIIMQYYGNEDLRNFILEKCTILQTIKMMRDKASGKPLELDEDVDGFSELSETLYRISQDLRLCGQRKQGIHINSWFCTQTGTQDLLLQIN